MNYLIAGSDDGGEGAALLYELLNTAKLNTLDPEAYLVNVLTRIADLLPLYRQSGMYAREGVELSRSTLDARRLAGWPGQVCALLQPLDDSLRDYVLANKKVHTDDTPVPALQPGRKTTKHGRLWTYVRDDRPAGITDASPSGSPTRRTARRAIRRSTWPGSLAQEGRASPD